MSTTENNQGEDGLRQRNMVSEPEEMNPAVGQGSLVTDESSAPLHENATARTTDLHRSSTSTTNGRRRYSAARRQNTFGSQRPSLGRVFTDMMRPERPLKGTPTYSQSFKAVVIHSWLNLLLVCVPISFALNFAIDSDLATFIVSFLAIIPLAKLLGFATEEIAMRVGNTIGGLLNATLGNAVELIVAILALVKCELEVVQSSLLGSILSNLLLVLGCCFLIGGLRFSEVGFSNASAQVNSSLLSVSIIAILMPAGFHASFGSSLSEAAEGNDILKMSRGISVIILLIYVAYIVFTLYTHAHLYDDKGDHLPPEEGIGGIGTHRFFKPAKSIGSKAARERMAEAHKAEMAQLDEEDEEVEEPSLNLPVTIITLIGVTVLVGFVAEWLVDSIDGVTQGGHVSTAWVGLILLIVGNAAEHVTAVVVAYKDKLDLAIGVAVGSSIQIALFVIPLLVIIAWIMDKPLSLLFDSFQSISLFLTVLTVNYTTADSRANWLEGFILLMFYVIIAVSFFFYPSTETDVSRLFSC